MCYSFFFFFNDTATTEIYTLSLHDALPICELRKVLPQSEPHLGHSPVRLRRRLRAKADRKSTRLNSSHLVISYAVFCLKKKNKTSDHTAKLIAHRCPLQVDPLRPLAKPIII